MLNVGCLLNQLIPTDVLDRAVTPFFHANAAVVRQHEGEERLLLVRGESYLQPARSRAGTLAR